MDIEDVFSTTGMTFEERITPKAQEFLDAVAARSKETGLRPVAARIRDRLVYEFGIEASRSTVQAWVKKNCV